MIEAYTKELRAPFLPLSLGSTDPGVSRVQEWLSLQGFTTGVDGDFGAATKAAVVAFQKARGLDRGDNLGIVDAATWGAMSAPLASAVALSSIADKTIGETICRIARQQLAVKAREVGGDNRGPFVRHYCRGQSVAWCQGFASTVTMMAARIWCQVDTPFPLVDGSGVMSLWVPWVAESAKAAGRFVPGSSAARIPVGSMFFVPGGQHGYVHVGIVTGDDGSTISTIEGNTNHAGGSNGYEVAARFRRKAANDYGIV